MNPIAKVTILVLVVGLAFGIAEYQRQDIAVDCRHRPAGPECRLAVSFRFAETVTVYAAGDLVAVRHERHEHVDVDDEPYQTDHLILTRRDGTTWISAHQDDAPRLAERLTAFLSDSAAPDFAAMASNRVYNWMIATFFPLVVFAAMNPDRYRIWGGAAAVFLTVVIGHYVLR